VQQGTDFGSVEEFGDQKTSNALVIVHVTTPSSCLPILEMTVVGDAGRWWGGAYDVAMMVVLPGFCSATLSKYRRVKMSEAWRDLKRPFGGMDSLKLAHA